MKARLALVVPSFLLLASCLGASRAGLAAENRDRPFDSDWRFLRAAAAGAEKPGFDDHAWRRLDLPHDWSIEDLPATNGAVPSPFDPTQSAGGAATGFVVGGTGWYRKHFALTPADSGKHVSIRFDGVYMNADVWINGQHLGDHPYGYTPVVYDLTPQLKPAAQDNVLAVQVRNTGKNSRWYSGSGIYRHVWLTVTDPVHIPAWGIYVTTTNISKTTATVIISTTIENGRGAEVEPDLRVRLIAPDGKASRAQLSDVRVLAGSQQAFTQTFSVDHPVLWSLESPALYRAEVELVENQKILDHSAATFGIRTIQVSATDGFRLNGEIVKLKGGCMHHDNGPLGSATIDRAEERRVQLMKAYGFNAIRTSHNPPSPAFLDACDRLGVLVIDEAFDMWEKPKNPDDYHRYFDDWWKRDLESMVLRDRNHPSVIFWSVGNEIPERADPSGVALCKQMIALIRQLDATRPITEAICDFWDNRGKNWPDSAAAFAPLEMGGYNYQWRQYVPDQKLFPARVMVGTESFPREAFQNWQAVLDHSWVIGDFVWTAWDYLGETGLGNAVLDNEQGRANRFPWFNAWCGDIDICGFKKPQLYYRDVVWGNSKIALAAHAPLPPGRTEKVSGWGWPDERQCWTWPGCESRPIDVAVYSGCESVRLELNGKEIGTKPVDNKMTARFQVPYQPGELRAIGLSKGKTVASASLRTAGAPKAIRLIADRSTIRADRNDLSYVTVEVVDGNGQLIPNATIPVHFSVEGAGELAATGSPCPNDASSFRLPVRKTFEGHCLAILRPQGGPGKITLQAEADGLKSATVTVKAR